MELVTTGLNSARLAEMYLSMLFVTLLMFWDYPLLLVAAFVGRTLRLRLARRHTPQALPVLVVIPSLLRKRDELTSMQSTVRSIATNGYPGPLVIILSIDGADDAPPLVRELETWSRGCSWGPHTSLYVTGTPGRHGKPMAIDHGIDFMRSLVRQRVFPEFPPVYISTDADADLGPNALWAIVSRLQRPNFLTGTPPHIVAGGLYVRNDNFWQGWRHFATMEGQLILQVAREYFVSNVSRFNIRPQPITGIPGAFYATWSELYTALPAYMGYLQTLRFRHWLGWWVGIAPPKFSETRAAPLPERVAGDTDDTVTAYVGTLARWENGHFNFDPPATPLHALYYMLRTLFVARPIQYAPDARVYTSSPTTVKSLFKQRRRWNSARVELTLRLWPSLGFHWGLGLPAIVVQTFMARGLIGGLFTYFFIPFVLFPHHLLLGFILGYACQLLVQATLTALSLVITGELEYWRIGLCLPFTPLYNFVFKWLPTVVGIGCDVLLFGNVTGFSPEWTLKKGESIRIALLFRLRRLASLLVRSVVCGDVPFGAFWFGWRETPWTPSGYEGWTTKKRPPAIIPPPDRWFPKVRRGRFMKRSDT